MGRIRPLIGVLEVSHPLDPPVITLAVHMVPQTVPGGPRVRSVRIMTRSTNSVETVLLFNDVSAYFKVGTKPLVKRECSSLF